MVVTLANAIEQTPTEEQRPEHRFWKTMGTKFLALMLYAAAVKGLSVAEVLRWLDSREDQQVKDIPGLGRGGQELAAWVRREEEYATLGANVVVELNSESRARRSTSRAWAITRRAQRAHRRQADRQQRDRYRQADRTSRTDRTGQARGRSKSGR